MLLGRIIAIFRLVILLTFIFAFINFTFLNGSFQTTLVNMVFSIGLLMVVKDPTSDLVRSFIMLLESDDTNDR